MNENQRAKPLKPVIYFLAGIALTIIALILFQNYSNLPENNPLLSADQPQDLETPVIASTDAAPQEKITPTVTAQLSPTAIFVPVDVNTTVDDDMNQVGVLAFSMMDGLHQHIFVYHPQFFPLTRLTNNLWDDTFPSFSHDGTRLAYASNQNGNWDIYILDLVSYSLTNLTHSDNYESHPSWSPDDQWLVYESDRNGNLDLFIQNPSQPEEDPIQLTLSEADDYQPAWSSDGRQIAYTSIASGNEDIWIANLDAVEGRYKNVSAQPETLEMEPFWSPAEYTLFWASNQSLGQEIVQKVQKPGETGNAIISGSIGAFHPQGEDIAVAFHTTNGTSIGIYETASGTMKFPFQVMPGRINGITWGNQNLELLLPLLNQSAVSASPASWTYLQDASSLIPENRMGLVKILDIETAYPYLHDEVNESFTNLHHSTAQILGWDFLKELENAFVPITQPAPPMIEDYWLYTGRAFEIDDAPASANWLVTIREDIEGKTYWRIYLKPIDQSGAVGDKLHQRAWSFSLRTQGNPEAYEQGGAYTQSIPDGYWVDFTALANQFDWVRIPALLNWRTYYPGTQHTIYVQKEYLDLEAALLELYPPEALLPPATDSLFPIRPTAVPEEEND